MRKITTFAAATVAATALGCGSAVAVGAFSNDPPTSAPWMVRPCKDSADDTTILERNCYWTTSMGTWTDVDGNPVTVGFWIRKIPNQPLICWLFSPDQQAFDTDRCYSTSTAKHKIASRDLSA